MTINNDVKVSIGVIVLLVSAFFGCYRLISAELDKKIDKTVIELRLEIKDTRITTLENTQELKIQSLKEKVNNNSSQLTKNNEKLIEIDKKLDILITKLEQNL